MTYIHAFITITNIFVVFFIVGATAIADVLMWMPRIGPSELFQTPPITQPRPFHWLLHSERIRCNWSIRPTKTLNPPSSFPLYIFFFCFVFFLFDFEKPKDNMLYIYINCALLPVSVFNLGFIFYQSLLSHSNLVSFRFSSSICLLSLVQQLCLLNTWSQIDKVCNCIK